MVKAILNYASPKTGGGFYNYFVLANERLNKLTDLQLSPGIPDKVKLIIFLVVLMCSLIVILKKSKHWQALLLTIIFTFLYVLLTFINKGAVLLHQIFPIYALTTLWLAILMSTQFKKIAILLISVVIFYNLRSSTHFVIDAQLNFFGKDPGSWLFLTKLAQDISQNETGPFGYFVYSPDVFAYSSRYALKYEFQHLGAEANEYQKLAATYIISSPIPPDRPDLSYVWWR